MPVACSVRSDPGLVGSAKWWHSFTTQEFSGGLSHRSPEGFQNSLSWLTVGDDVLETDVQSAVCFLWLRESEGELVWINLR